MTRENLTSVARGAAKTTAVAAVALGLVACQTAYERTQQAAETPIDLNGRAYRVLTDYDKTVGGYMNWVRRADGAMTGDEAGRADAVAIVTQKIGPFLCAGRPFEVMPEPPKRSLRPPSTFYQPESARWVVIADCPKR